MRAFPLTWSAVLISALVAGCDAARSAPVHQAQHVDSVVPRAEALRRFQSGLTEPAGFTGGTRSRDELVRRFVRALEARDTAALARLTLTRSEFAFLYYPTNPQSLPPYDLSAGLMWFMLEGNSSKGLAHVLEERGGKSLAFVGYRCEGQASREGENTVWAPCLIRRLQATPEPSLAFAR